MLHVLTKCFKFWGFLCPWILPRDFLFQTDDSMPSSEKLWLYPLKQSSYRRLELTLLLSRHSLPELVRQYNNTV